jgi:hypothetical protein
MPGMDAIALLENLVKVKAVGMGRWRHNPSSGSGYNKKHNYNIRIIVIIKDILYKVAIEAVSGSKEVAVHKIEFDSRKIEVNDVLSLFVVLFQTGMIIFKSNRTRE